MATNCSLRLSRVPSAQNPADPPSRSLSQADSHLSDACWARLQVVFGGTSGHSSSAYAKQKASLKKELSAFLCSLPGNRTLFSATPKDVCRFLAWKDSWGKTQVHITSCPNLGKHNVHDCGCPTRLFFATMDSYIGKLQAIFKDAGREGDWNTALALGNPAASAEVHNYLKAFLSGQLQALVTPKQATPLFLSKLLHLSCFIQGKMSSPGITATQLFVYARDLLKALFFSGDEANDLTLVKTQDIMRFPSVLRWSSITSGENPSGTAPPIFLRYVAIQICLYVQ